MNNELKTESIIPHELLDEITRKVVEIRNAVKSVSQDGLRDLILQRATSDKKFQWDEKALLLIAIEEYVIRCGTKETLQSDYNEMKRACNNGKKVANELAQKLQIVLGG